MKLSILLKLIAIPLVCAPLASPAVAEVIKVGVILPLSGPAADYGQSIENSIRLAKSDRPSGFTNIKFIFEDAAHNPKLAVTAFHKLIDQDKVNLVYTFGVSFCKALAPLAEARKIPLVGQCIDQESSRGKNYVLRFMNYTDEYLFAQTKYLSEIGVQKIGVLLADHAYLEEMYAALKRNLQPGQTVEIIDQLPIHDMELRSSITKIRTNNYDAVGVFLYAGQIAHYYRLAKEQKLDKPSFGTNFFESESEISLARGAMDGALFANNFTHPSFRKRYLEHYGNTSQIGFGALAYEFSMVLAGIATELNTDKERAGLLEKISNISTQHGSAAGPYQFTRSDVAGQYFKFPIAVKQINGMKIDIKKVF